MKSKHNLILLEMVLSLLFFSLAAAVCAQLFVKAHTLERASADLSRSVLLAQSAADVFRAGDGSPEAAAETLGGRLEGAVLSVSYDEEGVPCDEEGCVYLLILAHSSDGAVSYGDISVSREGDVLYTLRSSKALTDGRSGVAP